MKRRDQRIIVMTCLYQFYLVDKNIDDIFDDNLDIDDKESISFIVETTINTIENREIIEKNITDNLTESWDFDRLGMLEQMILLMSGYEILFTDIDKAIVINEAIEIARKYCDQDATRLINGVLDKICKPTP